MNTKKSPESWKRVYPLNTFVIFSFLELCDESDKIVVVLGWLENLLPL
jgi:hypothetical protein